MFYGHCAKVKPRRDEVEEAPERLNRSGMGLLTGLVLGAGIWAAIFSVAGVIKV
jgi:hypothetical protein